MIQRLKEASHEVWNENPAGKWILMGATARWVGVQCISFYMPLYFTNVYPEFQNTFSVGNSLIYLIPAPLSSLLGGFLSDKLEKKTYFAMPSVIMGSTALAAPLICTALLRQDSFEVSLGLLALHYCVCESWYSPAITML